MTKTAPALIGIALVSLSARTSFADNGTDSAAPEATLEEIVVSAQKREENLNKVPISIAALTPEVMAESGVKSFSDVAALVPGVELDSASGFGPLLTNVAIRG